MDLKIEKWSLLASQRPLSSITALSRCWERAGGRSRPYVVAHTT